MEVVSYRPIADFPGYRVGDDGSVWSSRNGRSTTPGAWKRLAINKEAKVQLWRGNNRKTFTVASLVLRAFVGPRPLGFQPYHFPDPNPANCSLSNLRWAPIGSHMTGNSRAWKKGHRPPPRLNVARGERCASAILSEDDVREIRSIGASNEFAHGEIAEIFGVSRTAVQRIIAGKSWSHVDRGEYVPIPTVFSKGDQFPLSKMTSEDVIKIRRLDREGVPKKEISRRIGVSLGAVYGVVSGRSWKHVPDDPAQNPEP